MDSRLMVPTTIHLLSGRQAFTTVLRRQKFTSARDNRADIVKRIAKEDSSQPLLYFVKVYDWMPFSVASYPKEQLIGSGLVADNRSLSNQPLFSWEIYPTRKMVDITRMWLTAALKTLITSARGYATVFIILNDYILSGQPSHTGTLSSLCTGVSISLDH
ncbi:hypothetical protein BDY19DRAFT_726874 [Irpex rosettiformis]|uniref:Uncharacterized protein n=1 Tax=Irpex rosettiformis TaxID=378272 RepID=A0ACB8U8K1_9APHY|nr:hypothetical protein BDY19DRAFT_726874 [Irpex rosettiformis]